MSKTAALLLANGFEEAEAIMVLDALVRCKIDVVTISCADDLNIASYHGLKMQADKMLSDVSGQLFDSVIIPGGPEGSVSLAGSTQVVDFIKKHDEASKLICPICSAAARVLGGNQLLKGRRYTCSGDLYQQVTDGVYVENNVVVDGNLVSGKGLGVAFDFAFTIAMCLTGDKEEVNFQADHAYHQWDQSALN